MANLPSVLLLQLLLGSSALCVLQKNSTHLKSVHPGENITLHCNITTDYQISWYHQSEEELKLLISAQRRKLDNHFSLNYNVDEDHYDVNENSSTVDLVIIGVNETDLGLYYCGGRNATVPIQFGKPIRLNFTGRTDEEDESFDAEQSPASPDPPDAKLNWIIIIILLVVCLVSILLNIISLIIFCYRMRATSKTCCINTGKPAAKEQELQYISPLDNRDLRPAAERNTESALDTVTYAKITRPSERPPA